MAQEKKRYKLQAGAGPGGTNTKPLGMHTAVYVWWMEIRYGEPRRRPNMCVFATTMLIHESLEQETRGGLFTTECSRSRFARREGDTSRRKTPILHKQGLSASKVLSLFILSYIGGPSYATYDEQGKPPETASWPKWF